MKSWRGKSGTQILFGACQAVGHLCNYKAVGHLKGPFFFLSVVFLSLWSGSLVWFSGLVLWSGSLVWFSGLALWSGSLVWLSGLARQYLPQE